ncbi:CCR4-NOT transcription complex subunit 3 isoform X8 [Neodiprion pinetum]|uniref:CCR4-NOT transcription complex subunit 3 isoform X8 n=1 Tax=Neodiprion lecontei TaxID=441921 RepID=A0ABM3FK67_NEOLC|nr:CCR4-NOT transcription complex subunit 3 isoform X8 [Neodiprion fabricii]XP_046469286.1 CCR4-NOT transcription complex subunit 3 isoform X8 [Neodiprion pinetum]XP_046588393.1 CCR4-NOT transcription complex subunit 3 isoform X8 [Neodiprion lecontei]XP_046606817.1 CCR4-NOT transcription complex subunit 3 isoform X8 [Neodiprion virginianus]
MWILNKIPFNILYLLKKEILITSFCTNNVGVKMREMKGEIDRCLKKVTEGVETFEDIWQKVHNATNSNQKEKYEADLKKEIKKLQRLRDQIKSWIASGEIKDKSTLLDYRKLIETQMERFKVVERETKTKAYSKEGLGAAQKLDPAQKEREEVSNWLANSIDALNLQIKRIKDDVEYYIESSQEPDFEENEYIYDDIIGLDEVELSGVGIPSSATTDSNNSNETGGTPTSTNSGTSPIPSPPLSSTMHNHSSDSSTDMDKKTKPVKPTAVRPLLNSQGSIPTTGSTTVIKMSLLSSSTPSKPIPMTSSHSSPSATINHIATSNAGNFATVAASHINSQVIHSTSSKTSSHGSENGLLSSSSTSSVASNVPPTIMQQHNNPPPLQPSHILLNQQSQNHNSETEMTTPIPSSSSPPSPVSSRSSPLPANSCSPVPSATNGLISKIPDGMSSLKSIAQQVIVRAGIEIPPSEPTRNLFDTTKVSNATSEAHIPPLLGVAPLGPVPLQKEHQLQFQMMEAAYYHMPHPSDSERLRSYLPRNLCKTPPYYQQVQLPHSDTVEFFQRLSTETLFFIFYYMEGSKGQYLAAKALKKQSWRFHTKYMMWFQRHEEPKVINEEYEQGTYIYFDYEKWGQRKKEGFTFEYKYLEDRDLN